MEESVLPLLEINRFRPRNQAIFDEGDQYLRWKLLGRALQHRLLRSNPTLRYLLLLKNVDVLQSHLPTRANRLTTRWNQLIDHQQSNFAVYMNCVQKQIDLTDRQHSNFAVYMDRQRSLYRMQRALEMEMRQLGMTIPPLAASEEASMRTSEDDDDDDDETWSTYGNNNKRPAS